MRVAVLGLGFMGSTHLKALRDVRDAELVAVYSQDEKKLTGDLTSVGGNLGLSERAAKSPHYSGPIRLY